jgi:hypothetical protein
MKHVLILFQLAAIAVMSVACGGGGGSEPSSGSGGGGGGGGGGGAQTEFAAVILPMFQADCITCHGGAGDLDLESYADVMLGGISGLAVIPGDPDNSLLIKRLEGTIAPQMPLDLPPLSQPQIDTIRDWIAEGALDN